MSAYLYDTAIIENLQHIVGDDRIRIVVIDNAMDVIPRLDDDKFMLPLITLTRTGWSIQSQNNNHSARYEGALSEIQYNANKFCDLNLKRAQFVPMTITYSLDVWTRYRQENDEIIRELYWYYMTSPTLQIKVPYDLDFDHNFNLFLEQDIEDNSDLSQHLNRGEYFRQTINMYTDDAKLWKSASRGPSSILIRYQYDEPNVNAASRDMRSASTEDENA